MNRQRLILAILLVLLALTVGYSIIWFPRQQQAEKGSRAPGGSPSGGARKGGAGAENRVRLDLLQQDRARFTGFKKNIFAPVFRDLSKLPPVKPVIPAPPPPPPPPPVAPVPAVSPVEQELAQFTFLGFLQKDRNKTIFLAKNKEIFLVKKGERIADRYEAAAITDEALTIRQIGGTTEIVIPLIENQSLRVAAQHQAGSPAQLPARPRRPERPAAPRPPAGVPVPAPAEALPAGE